MVWNRVGGGEGWGEREECAPSGQLLIKPKVIRKFSVFLISLENRNKKLLEIISFITFVCRQQTKNIWIFIKTYVISWNVLV